MADRMWWGFAVGAYGGHGEDLILPHAQTPTCWGQSWSGGGGALCGESPVRVRWFSEYVEQTLGRNGTYENCRGDDTGYWQLLICWNATAPDTLHVAVGSPQNHTGNYPHFILFRFYNCATPSCTATIRQIPLPMGVKYHQELLNP